MTMQPLPSEGGPSLHPQPMTGAAPSTAALLQRIERLENALERLKVNPLDGVVHGPTNGWPWWPTR